MIVIDNADILLPDNMYEIIIADNSNQYILVGKDTRKYGAVEESIVTIIEDNLTFSLFYPLMPKV